MTTLAPVPCTRAALRVITAVAAGLVGVTASACGGSGGGPSDGSGQVVVLAASSLTDAFERLADQFEAANPGVEVLLSFGASSTLAEQVRQGAPADVLATADEATMQLVADADALLGDPQLLARNRLAIAVEPDNPTGVTGLSDLAAGGRVVVLCAPEVPCGRLAAAALAAAGVDLEPASYEANVRSVLGKVTLGEADAGIVYATDVVAAGGGVDGVAIPDGQNQETAYPVAVVDGPNPTVAERFVSFVTGPEAAAVLAALGFEPA